MTTTLAPSTRGSKTKDEKCGHDSLGFVCSRKANHAGLHRDRNGNTWAQEQTAPADEAPAAENAPQCEAAIEEYRCDKPAGHEGSHVNSARGMLVWNDEDPAQRAFEATQAEAGDAIKTTVDGQEANVVLDGISGAPVQAELITTPIEERVRAIAGKRIELLEAELAKKRAGERVKMLQTELNEMVDALVAQVDGVQPLPLSQSDDNEQAEEAQLTGREQRALAMADDALEGEETVAPAQERETVPLSTQQPGIYVADGDGPEA